MRAREQFPTLDLAKLMGAFELIRWGRNAEAVKLVDALPASLGFRGQAGYIIGRSGDRPRAEAWIKALRALPDTTWLLHTALAYSYLGLGDTTRTLDEFEAALRKREILPKWVPLGHRMFDPIRGSARFAAVLHAYGLDEKLFIPPNKGRPGN